MRARFNANLLRDIFHKSDHDILNVFANISLGELDLKNGYLVKNAVVDFIPENGEVKDFNFHISLDEKKFLGLEGSNIKFKGVGQMEKGEEVHSFEIEGPVKTFKVTYISAKNESGPGYIVKFNTFDFDFDTSKLQLTAKGDAAGVVKDKLEDLKEWIHQTLISKVV